ncbi:MAG TPA: BrnT family toxin [Rhizomicrobium sp.]
MFEWDEAKRLRTIEERGLDFVDAVLVFDGRPAVHIPATYGNEERVLSVASIEGRFYTVVWTWRSGFRRIISFRRSRDGEENLYRAAHR